MSNRNQKYTSLQKIEDAYLELLGETQPAKKRRLASKKQAIKRFNVRQSSQTFQIETRSRTTASITLKKQQSREVQTANKEEKLESKIEVNTKVYIL